MGNIWKNKNLNDLPNEVWKDINGYSNHKISNMGRVKAMVCILESGYKRKTKIKSQFKREHKGKDAIDMSVRMVRNNDKKEHSENVCNLVGIHFLGGKSTKQEYWHKNTDYTDNRASNIDILTRYGLQELKRHLGIRDGQFSSTAEHRKWLMNGNGKFVDGVLVEKRCRKCGEMLPLESFKIADKDKHRVVDGIPTHMSGRCYICVATSAGIKNIGAITESMRLAEEEHKKRCWSCGDIKDLDDFTKSKREKYGVGSACKVCAGILQKKYEKNRKNKINFPI